MNQKNEYATDGLTLEEDRQLSALLEKWNGGRFSASVFTQLARMIPQPIVEVVFLRFHNGSLETLLIPRPENDPVWPGMYHTPGTALRVADFQRPDKKPLQGAFERIQREVGFDFDPPFSAGRLYRLVERGPEVIDLFVHKTGDPSLKEGHLWSPVRELAENPLFIQHQLGHVTAATEYFKRFLLYLR